MEYLLLFGGGGTIVLAVFLFMWRLWKQSVEVEVRQNENQLLKESLQAQRDTADLLANPRRNRTDIADIL